MSPSTPTVLINHHLIYSPANLFIREVKCILAALNSPQPLGKGYWISTTWLTNAKKYFEAINLPNIEAYINTNNNIRKTPTKPTTNRKQKIRARRGSDALPPWPSMTADIVCSHNNLNLVKSNLPGNKRRLLTHSPDHLLTHSPNHLLTHSPKVNRLTIMVFLAQILSTRTTIQV